MSSIYVKDCNLTKINLNKNGCQLCNKIWVLLGVFMFSVFKAKSELKKIQIIQDPSLLKKQIQSKLTAIGH